MFEAFRQGYDETSGGARLSVAIGTVIGRIAKWAVNGAVFSFAAVTVARLLGVSI